MLQLCPYTHSISSHEHAFRIQQASLVWRQKTAAIHEHSRGATTERDNRLMRPKTDGANDPAKVTNAKKYERHKYLLLVHTTSTYVPLLNSKLEHRVLLLNGWPLSSFLQLERFLNSSLRIHRNAHSDRLSYCSCLFVRNNTSLPKKHAILSNAINGSFRFLHGAENTPCILHSALNVCGKTLNTTRARQYRFCIRFADAPRNPTRSLQTYG